MTRTRNSIYPRQASRTAEFGSFCPVLESDPGSEDMASQATSALLVSRSVAAQSAFDVSGH